MYIEDADVKAAVCHWLAAVKGLEVKPEELLPVFQTDGDYEDRTQTMIGFKFDYGKAAESKP